MGKCVVFCCLNKLVSGLIAGTLKISKRKHMERDGSKDSEIQDVSKVQGERSQEVVN